MAQVDILYTKIYNELALRAQRGGDAAAEYALARARKHAPVRKLFRGTTYRISKRGFREPINRRVTAEGIQRVGQANSMIPLLRTRNRAGKFEFISGDFRAVKGGQLQKVNSGSRRNAQGVKIPKPPGEQKEGELVLFSRTQGGRGKNFVPRTPQAVSGESLMITGKAGKPVRAITARGLYEVRSGRANFTVSKRAGGDGITRVGGRLRGELHVEGPVTEDGIMWWYVVSATKDPETGRLYPRDQEFGTRHHPPHPFLRPGLHESRGPFRRFVRESIRGGAPR